MQHVHPQWHSHTKQPQPALESLWPSLLNESEPRLPTIDMIIECIDPKLYTALHKLRQTIIAKDQKDESGRPSRMHAQQSPFISINFHLNKMAPGDHKDDNSLFCGWDTIVPLGPFTSCQLELKKLGIAVPSRPGSIYLI